MIHQNIQQQNSTQQKRPHSKRYILRLFADNPRVIPVFIGVAIILFVGVMLSLQMPFLVGEAADIIAGTASGDLRRLIILLAVLYSIIALLHVVEEVCINNMMTRMVTRGYRLRISKKIRELDVSFVDNHPHGDILSRTMDDVSNFGGSGTGTLIRQGVGSLVFIFGIGIGLFGLNPFLPLVVFGVVILTIVLGGIFTGAIGKYFSQLQERVGDLNAHITESFSAHDVIKAYNLQGHSISQFEGLNRRLRNTAYKAFSLVAWGWPIMTLLNTISFIAVGIFGAFLAINGYVTPGEILTILMLTQMLNAPMLGIVQLLIELQRAKASGKRIYDILDADEMLDFADSFGGEVVVAGGASVGSSAVVGSAVGGTNLVKASDKRTSNKRPNNKRPLEFNNSLTFSNINFRYKDDVPLIDNLNVHIPKGKKVAIVGPTGGGKTTLVNLLMRFYDAQSGQILIDDTNIYECDRNSVRDLFGMVLQDVWLFNGTIRDNITYGKEGASETQIEAACKKAHIDRFINTLPDGYETIINEDATNISQGQKQLITIARAFLANKPILILDEATSNVDTLTEALVQDAMRELLKHKTSFVIAHRLSTIVDSDLILVINNGQIIEQGTHHSLLSAGGFYAELYNSQFAM